MKVIFKQSVNLFRRNVFLITCYLIFFAMIHGLNLVVSLPYKMAVLKDFFEWLPLNMAFCLLLFVFFMVISYEFYSMITRRHLEEIHAVSSRGELRFYACQTVILLILLAVALLSIWAWGTASCYYSNILHTSYYTYFLKIMALYYFLPGIIGCLVGFVTADKLKRRSAYPVIAVLTFVGSPFFSQAPYLLYGIVPENVQLSLHRVFDLFALAPYETNMFVNYGYGIPAEAFRVQGFFFLIFLLAGIIILSYRKRYAKPFWKLVGVGALCVSLVCGSLSVFDRGSVYLRNVERPDTTSAFKHKCAELTDEKGRDKYADFKILSYDMNLKIRNKLKAEISLKLSASEPKEVYDFTLGYIYNVKDVKDENGVSLRFERDADYLFVYPADKSKIPEIHISYEGYCSAFYTNSQGVYLPGFYCWYPVEGCRRIMEYGDWNNWNMSFPRDEKRFNVNVDYNKDVYSNLTQDENGHFTGTADSLTLTAGFYEAHDLSFGDTKVRLCCNIYNYKYAESELEEKLKNTQLAISEYNELLNTDLSYDFNGKTIICYSGDYEFIGSDYVIMGTNTEPEDIAKAYVIQSVPQNENKIDLHSLFINEIRNGDRFEYMATATGLSPELKPQQDLAAAVVEKMNEKGEQEVLSEIYRYLTDTNDTRSSQEFVQSL